MRREWQFDWGWAAFWFLVYVVTYSWLGLTVALLVFAVSVVACIEGMQKR